MNRPIDPRLFGANTTATSPLLARTPASKNKYVVNARTKKLLDDAYSDRVIAQGRKSRNKTTGARKLKSSKERAAVLDKHGTLYKRIAYHLSKGRSVADIVIRENLPASVVTEIINSLPK